MEVSAIVVTRGNVDMKPVLASLPEEWEKIVWDNSRIIPYAPEYAFFGPGATPARVVGPRANGGMDFSVYGRYAAIEFASYDLIYAQDDDVIVSDPQAIVTAHAQYSPSTWGNFADPNNCKYVVANMPQEFRHEGYTDSCLVGFGACFHRDLPFKAFERFVEGRPAWETHPMVGFKYDEVESYKEQRAQFLRCCDVVFTGLTPRVLVDVPKTDREFASDDDRMWKQPSHYGERVKMLDLVRRIRDAE
jgi:hypothetical protein